MRPDARPLSWITWFILAASAVLTIAALAASSTINAEGLGAHDAGLALFLAFASGAALLAAMYATPLLALAGLLLMFRYRDAGLRLLAAAVVLSLPLLVQVWAG